MRQAFSRRGADESDVILHHDLLIGQATLYNTPESRYEHLPLRRGVYLLAMDARIDNREELARVLELPDRPSAEIGDSEFILAAYAKWGEACAEKLLGDFAFVLWDASRNALFCARDFIGVRPFYYHIDSDRFLFGSDLEALIVASGIRPTLRDESLAVYIAHRQLVDPRHTFFREFKRLEGGYTMTVAREHVRFRRYWDPVRVDGGRDLRSREAWVDAIRHTFEDAVRVRLRSRYPVAAHLSGGLDSSPIAVSAARSLSSSGYRLPVYSWQPRPEAGDNLNHFEWAYALETARRESMELHFSDLTAEKIREGMRTHNLLTERGSALWYEIDIRRDLKRRGVRTMLSGWGGDEFLSNHGYAFYPQMLLEGRWLRFARALRARIATWGMSRREIIKFLYLQVAVPLLPDTWYCHLPYLHRRCGKNEDLNRYRPEFAPLVAEAYRKKNHIFNRYTSATVRRDLLRAWENGHVQARLNHWSQEARDVPMEYAFPLLDRRLVELSFSLPARWLIADGYDRRIYRDAMKPYLSADLLWGTHKREPKRWRRISEVLRELADLLPEESVEGDRYWRDTKDLSIEERIARYYFLSSCQNLDEFLIKN